ncbi:MAG: NADH-quinone oxidoreductase subunit M, partial [Prevotella sp.]|nr:NADH-quinone oxidoreductase subunit M [Prevotella sp.]
MSILTLFVIIPALMLVGLWLAHNLNQVRGVMVVGSTLLLALSVYLTIDFIHLRQTMSAEQYPML